MISFKGKQFPKHIILHAVYFYLRYSVSLRELEEILAKTFNAAGVSFITKLRTAGQIFQNLDITNYWVQGEVLTNFQVFTTAPDAMGLQLRIPYDGPEGPIDRHRMPTVLRALGLR